jgi:hypothetical protein
MSQKNNEELIDFLQNESEFSRYIIRDFEMSVIERVFDYFSYDSWRVVLEFLQNAHKISSEEHPVLYELLKMKIDSHLSLDRKLGKYILSKKRIVTESEAEDFCGNYWLFPVKETSE